MCGTTRAAPQHYSTAGGGRHLEGVDTVALLVGVVHEVHGRGDHRRWGAQDCAGDIARSEILASPGSDQVIKVSK